MNEGRTTAIFGAIAAIALIGAWLSRPTAVTDEDDFVIGIVGTEVFPDFADPSEAASLEIVRYDEELAQLKQFEVARDPKSKLWTLPSNDDYPADAAEQVRDATTPLIGMNIMSVESTAQSDHELYGVVDPSNEDLAAGSSGVGTLVRLKDEDDSILASLIIGKEVEQAEGQRYVRKSTEDAVYKVELDPAVFTTNFRDWIEGELLGVRSFDITSVGIRDYELQQTLTAVNLRRNFDADVSYDGSSSTWNLDKMEVYEGANVSEASLGENEELNSEFLNNLRTAVQDLEIIDVKRKPNGLAADLKADESLLQDEDSVKALQTQGFFPASINNVTEIFAAGGETIIGTEDGVQFVLRFGEATASMTSTAEEDESGGISRYLLVTARMDESKFPQPDLEPLPETVEEMLAREKAATAPAEIELPPLDPADIPGNTPADGDGNTEAAAGEAAEVPPSPKQPTAESAGDENAETPATENPPANDPPAENPAAEDGNTADGENSVKSDASAAENSSESTEAGSTEAGKNEAGSGQSEEGKSGDSQPTPDAEPAAPQEGSEEQKIEQEATPETAAAGQTGDDAAADADDSAAQEPAPQETEEELKERLEALRDQITRDNQRLLDERKEKVDAAQKRVQELNARFAEWYYVVSESVYDKLRANREDLIKAKDVEPAAGAAEGTAPFSQGVPGLNFGNPQLP